MKIGYARVSTSDQNFDLQTEALEKHGCTKIFTEKMSGSKSERAELARALDQLRAGDTLVVWKLDRLGRSVKQLVDLVSDLQKKEIHFTSLTDSIDTSTPAGRFFFHLMASLAEMERELIIERTRAGLNSARARGRKGGRPKALSPKDEDMVRSLMADRNTPIKDIATRFGVSRNTLYRVVAAR